MHHSRSDSAGRHSPTAEPDSRTFLPTKAHTRLLATENNMADDLAWISTAIRQPDDRELVYARAKHGTPQKVTFYASPERWIGSNIVYDFKYFVEWSALDSERKPPKRSE
jgi:hypothetical protein